MFHFQKKICPAKYEKQKWLTWNINFLSMYQLTFHLELLIKYHEIKIRLFMYFPCILQNYKISTKINLLIRLYRYLGTSEEQIYWELYFSIQNGIWNVYMYTKAVAVTRVEWLWTSFWDTLELIHVPFIHIFPIRTIFSLTTSPPWIAMSIFGNTLHQTTTLLFSS